MSLSYLCIIDEDRVLCGGYQPFLRRILTRLLGLVPAMAVAIIVGKPGIDNLLVISQVVLSIVLPFVAFPLIWLTSSQVVMRVRKPQALVQVEMAGRESAEEVVDAAKVTSTVEKEHEVVPTSTEKEWVEEEMVDYSNGWVLMCLSYAVWLIVLVANGYLIVTLAIA